MAYNSTIRAIKCKLINFSSDTVITICIKLGGHHFLFEIYFGTSLPPENGVKQGFALQACLSALLTMTRCSTYRFRDVFAQ